MDRLSKRERQERILKRLGSDVAVRISALAEAFAVTTETIRRDLDELSERGLLARTYGGAAVRSLSREPGVQLRSQALVDERQRIAEAAAALVEPGDVLMIDAGSTVAHFAAALAQAALEITVITNSLAVARALGQAETIAILVCPGDFRMTEEAVFGPETLAFLDRYHADIAFMGAGGVSAFEVTDADASGAWIKRKMIARAARSVLLADRTKMGGMQFSTVCPLSDIDDIITDAPVSDDMAAALREAGATLHVCATAPVD